MGYDYTWKIMILGEKEAGKTSFVNRFNLEIIHEDLNLTIGVDFYTKTINYDGRMVKLQFWVLGGEKRFRFLLRNYYLGTNAAIFLYNITYPSSLDQLPELTQVIRECAGNIPIMLVGTEAHLEEQRAITREKGMQMARKYNLSGFIEVSSKTGQNVDLLFKTISGLLFDRYLP